MQSKTQRTLVLQACLGILAAAAGASAHGASTAHASFTNIAITVTDLAPGDGVDASFSFIEAVTATRVQADTQNGRYPQPAPEVTVWEMETLLGALTPSTSAVVLGGMDASSAASPSSLAVSSSSTGGATLVTADVWSYTDSSLGMRGFVLAPHTSLTVSALATLAVTNDGASTGDETWQRSRAYAATWMILALGDGYSIPLGPLSRQSAIHLDTSWGAEDLSDSRLVSLTVSNTTDQAVRGSFAANVLVETNAPIPEPGTLVLCGLGLGIVALRHARRG